MKEKWIKFHAKPTQNPRLFLAKSMLVPRCVQVHSSREACELGKISAVPRLLTLSTFRKEKKRGKGLRDMREKDYLSFRLVQAGKIVTVLWPN